MIDKLALRDYILQRYLHSGGKISLCDYDVFGYANKWIFLLKLKSLERTGIIRHQFIKREYALYEVCEYFYAIPKVGEDVDKNNIKHNVNKKISLRKKLFNNRCKEITIKREMVSNMQMPNIGEHLGAKRAVKWIRGTYKGKSCNTLMINSITKQT